MSKLADFIAKLATDAAAREAFEANPTDYMTNEGLSDEQQAVVQSGNANKIREQICVTDNEELARIITETGQKEILIWIRDRDSSAS